LQLPESYSLEKKMKPSLKIFAMIIMITALVIMTIGSAFSAGTPVINPGTIPAAVLLGAVRYREFKTGPNEEIYLGIPDLDSGGAYLTQNDLNWSASNAITLTYDPISDKLITNVDNGSSDWTFEYLNYSNNVRDLIYGGDQSATDAALSSLTYLQIVVALREKSPALASFDNVFLDGISLGNFSGTNQTIRSWQVSGYDYSAGFTLTGVINLSGINSPAPDKNNIQISFGYLDTLAPVTSNVLAVPNPVAPSGNVLLTATVDDSSKGNSDIQSAEYLLGSGTWMPMTAQDDIYDSPTEDVVANFTAPAPGGDQTLCVRGTDSANNASPQVCTTLTIDDQGPLSSNLAAAPNPIGPGQQVTLNAVIDDSAVGGSTISNAQYNLAGGGWSPMTAQDGTFDQPIETTMVSFPAPILDGKYSLCVRGTDAVNNLGPDTCITLSVDDQGPSTTSVTVAPEIPSGGEVATLTATVDDSPTGGSNIQSAQYQLDGSAWEPMDAQDGVFDSHIEIVYAEFLTPDQEGTIEVCVRGRDIVGNTRAADCTQFTVSVSPAQPPEIYIPIVLRGQSNP
jgi:hypothetical protein